MSFCIEILRFKYICHSLVLLDKKYQVAEEKNFHAAVIFSKEARAVDRKKEIDLLLLNNTGNK